VLVAVAPIAGTPRIVSAAVNITKALGFAVGVEFGEAESDAGVGRGTRSRPHRWAERLRTSGTRPARGSRRRCCGRDACRPVRLQPRIGPRPLGRRSGILADHGAR